MRAPYQSPAFERLALTVGVCLTLVWAPATLADETASFYDGGGTLLNFGRATGWFFTPNEDLLVTALGVYDHDDPGLAQEHDVGIFEADGTPLVVTRIPSGLSGDLIDGTRFLEVGLVPLSIGEEYYIIANNWQVDHYVFGDGAVSYAPEIRWLGFGESDSNSIFRNVTRRGGLPGNLGPNFRFVPSCEPCDMNCDGEIDAFDIEPFLELLFDPDATPCAPCTGDVDGSGEINAFDIEPFLNCLFP